MNRIIPAFLALLFAAIAGAQTPDPDAYRAVFIPVFFVGPGAFGSSWTTDVELIHTGSGPLNLATEVLEGDPACESLCGCGLQKAVPEYKTMKICTSFSHPAGLLLYVPKGTAREDLQFMSRIRDLSRQADSAGTESPVVWREEFRRPGEDFLFGHLPVDKRFRTSLRIVQLDGAPGGARVRIFDKAALTQNPSAAKPLVDDSIPFQDQEVDPGDRFKPFRKTPRWLISIGDLVARYPALATVDGVVIQVGIGDSLAYPIHPDEVAWAMISVTNNTTQQVTIISPD